MRPSTRFRHWLAALLLVASPAVGGQLAPLLHPCGAASTELVGHHGGHAGHGDDHGDTGVPETCTCLGSCTSPAISTTSPTATLAVYEVPGPNTAPPLHESDADLVGDLPLDRLPPATAPPQT